MSAEHKEKRSIIEIGAIIVMVLVLGAMGYILVPTFHGPSRKPREAITHALLMNISMALEHYASDFSGRYPPDMSSNPKMLDGVPLKNSSQLLCYFLDSELMSDDGRRSGKFLGYRIKDKLKKGEESTYKTCQYMEMDFRVSFDCIVDPWGSPIFYDERKSEGSTKGTNPNTFVLMSGGREDKNSDVDIKDIDPGDWSMFDSDNLEKFDTKPSDYKDEIIIRTKTNDDIFNR